MQTKNILNINYLVLVALLITLLGSTSFVSAHPLLEPVEQAGSTSDLVGAVNALRAQYGLAPYEVDSGLMSEAQGQSEYQASIQQCTHQRADGSGPADHGISAENVACGAGLSVQGAIYGQWTDSIHNATMVGPNTGLVGAGVATVNGMTYYTLAVKRLSGEFVSRSQNNGSSNNTGGQAAANNPPQQSTGGIVTSTPNSDGSVSHIISYGETLVEIAQAYNVSLADLISINHLDPKNPAIYEHQALLVRLAFTATPNYTPTNTPRPPTRTPLPTRTPRPTLTVTPFHTPIPSFTPTATPIFQVPTLEELGPGRNVLAFTFIGISALGLVVLVLTSFGGRKGG